MSTSNAPRTYGIARSLSRFAGILTAAIAVLVLGGWVFDVAALESFGFMTTMKPNATLCLILAGIALWLRCRLDGAPAHAAALALAAAVLLIAGLTLLEHAFSLDLGIDQTLFRDPSADAGRMTPPVAVALALLGSALLLPGGRRSVIAAQTLALAAGLIAAILLLGNLYGASLLYRTRAYAPVGSHTAAALALLSAGMLGAWPDVGWPAGLLSDTSAGRMARRLLPVVILVPVVLGWIELRMRRERFDAAIVEALASALSALLLGGVVAGNAFISSRWDQRRREEQALRLRYGALLERASEAIIARELGGRVVYWNRGAERLYGFSEERALGAVGHELLATGLEGSRLSEDALLQRGEWTGEIAHTLRDGRRVMIESRQVLVREPDGRQIIIETNHDITERKRNELALQESEERLRLAAEAARIGLWSWDLATDRLDWTPGCYELFGVEPGVEISHAAFPGYVHPDDRERVRAEADRCIRAGAFYIVEFRIVRRGEVRWLASRGRTFCDERGRPDRMTGVVLDVTERVVEAHRREASLESERAARGEMERAARLKDEFLATVSHEVRTPLTAILGWARILQGKPDTVSVSRQLAVIERNAVALNQIVADLLDMSRILSGKLRISVEPIDLGRVVEEAAETVKPMAEARGVVLPQRIERDVTVRGDPGRLQQVVWNLLTNAIKFTAKGGRVEVSLRQEGSHATIKVKDTGKGIAATFLPHVFDRFRQEDASMTRQYAGLGLGLSLVKELVELHGGSVSAESAGLGRGASFTVRLPVSVVAVAPAPGASDSASAASSERPLMDPEALHGAKVLVVEDDPDARELIRQMLADHAAEVTSVASALEALATLARETPDVLVCDIGMPGIDGYELIRRVRALNPAGSRSVPAIALTAFIRAEDRDRALAAGYQMHLPKPVEPWRLVAAVTELRAGDPSQ